MGQLCSKLNNSKYSINLSIAKSEIKWELLTSAIIQNIAHYLVFNEIITIGVVCFLWRSAINDYRAFSECSQHNINISTKASHHRHLSIIAIGALHYIPSIQIKLQNFEFSVTNNQLMPVLLNMGHLKELVVPIECMLKWQLQFEFNPNLKALIHLTMYSASLAQIPVSIDLIQHLTQLPQLLLLRIRHAIIDIFELSNLNLNTFNRLNNLYLINCEWEYAYGPESCTTQSALRLFIESVINLKHLKGFSMSTTPINSETLQLICDLSQQLITLSICDNHIPLGTESIISIIQLNTLTALDLFYLSNLTDSILISICSSCNQLKRISIVYSQLITFQGLKHSVINLTNLISLALISLSTAITDELLRLIARDLLKIQLLSIWNNTDSLITLSGILQLTECKLLSRLEIPNNIYLEHKSELLLLLGHCITINEIRNIGFPDSLINIKDSSNLTEIYSNKSHNHNNKYSSLARYFHYIK